MTLMSPDDWSQKRGGFSLHQLWVTPRDPAERFASGDYPTLSRGPPPALMRSKSTTDSSVLFSAAVL